MKLSDEMQGQVDHVMGNGLTILDQQLRAFRKSRDAGPAKKMLRQLVETATKMKAVLADQELDTSEEELTAELLHAENEVERYRLLIHQLYPQ